MAERDFALDRRSTAGEPLAERRVERLSYVGMPDLAANLSESLGFDGAGRDIGGCPLA